MNGTRMKQLSEEIGQRSWIFIEMKFTHTEKKRPCGAF